MGNTGGKLSPADREFQGNRSGWNKAQKMKIKVDGSLKEIRMIVVGKMGVGKSAFCNILLGSARFRSQDSWSPVTTNVQAGCVDRGNRNIFVIDTPGFRDGEKTSDQEIVEMAGHICEHFLRISPGFHCIVLMLNADERFSREDKEIIDDVKKVFGNDVMDHMILVFTRCTSDDDLSKLTKTTDPDFKKLLEEVKGRVFAIFRDCADYEKQERVNSFCKMVDDLCKDIGALYTNEMLLEAWRVVESEIKTPQDRLKIKDLQKKIDSLHLVRYFLNLFRS
ncbi:GTPase IMAP family member 7-like [Ostrea edulis]|uniref:GTPase IMAP family member 7-like n=1 Tax=Ostrea edulis TaxID=37623 RepID=UPI002095ADE5|nr:GTPase IMAP family member 7-like [Ostrea edulis]